MALPSRNVTLMYVEMLIRVSCVVPSSEISALYGVQYVVMNR